MSGLAVMPAPIPLPQERWYTLAEVSAQLGRSPSRLRHLILDHELPRRKVRQGRHPRRVIQISYQTLLRLRRLTNQ